MRPWRGYRERRPTADELRAWFRDAYPDREFGRAILGGAVSGGLEIIDCDNWEVAEHGCASVKAKAPGLLKRLVRVRSPRPGLHAYYRCAVSGGNQKRARIPDPEKGGKKPKTIIEWKGAGGYCLAPPSPGACHKSGRCSRFLGGKDLTQVPTVSPEERAVLLSSARQRNRWEPPRPKVPFPKKSAAGDRPGDHFNARADWGDILQPHGWTYAGSSGDGADYWTRPDKDCGTSATTNHGGTDLLYVFSSNADPFEQDTAYSKFHAYALLEHDGDFHAAARALAAQGYGGGRRGRRSHQTELYARYGGYTRRSTKG